MWFCNNYELRLNNALIGALIKRINKMSAQLDNLNATVDRLATVAAALVIEVNDLKTNSDSPASVQAVNDKLAPIVDSLQALVP